MERKTWETSLDRGRRQQVGQKDKQLWEYWTRTFAGGQGDRGSWERLVL